VLGWSVRSLAFALEAFSVFVKLLPAGAVSVLLCWSCFCFGVFCCLFVQQYLYSGVVLSVGGVPDLLGVLF